MSLLDKLFPEPNSDPQPDPPETEPIVAFRCWKLDESREGVPVLYSVTQDFCWLPYEPAKGDLTVDGGGIYAFKSQQEAAIYLESDNYIMGEVNLWGGVLDHSNGYRAEFGYPKELWVNKDFDATMIVRLEETYGVPVVIKEDFPVIATVPPPPPMKFTSGIQPGIMEIIRDVVYDREALSGQRQHLFCRPIGMAVTNARGENIMKSWERTNMVQPGMLSAPNRFVIKAIRCVFLEADGRPVPITDPIYWETTLDLRVSMKTYWRSPVAYVADPVILLGGTDWSKIPAAERLNLIHCISAPLTVPDTAIPGTSSRASVEGVAIEQQQNFDVQIEGQQQWPDREVLVALEGVCGRAIF